MLPAKRKAVRFSRSVVSDPATPWTAARQASLSITNSRSLLKLISIEWVMPSSHLVPYREVNVNGIGRGKKKKLFRMTVAASFLRLSLFSLRSYTSSESELWLVH